MEVLIDVSAKAALSCGGVDQRVGEKENGPCCRAVACMERERGSCADGKLGP